MLKQVSKGFKQFMTRERKPPYSGKYGTSVTEISSDGKDICVTFTFLSGHRYCCSSAGCHHGLLFDSDYERLRNCFEIAGGKVGRPMRIHMRVVCEGGALFAEDPGHNRPSFKAIPNKLEHVELCDEAEAAR